MMRRMIEYLLVSCVAIAAATAQVAGTDSDLERHLRGLPFPTPKITLPRFPDRTVDIRSHGAVPDGQTMNTEAFRKAIEECAKSGGGRVLVPAGMWLTGPIAFASNIDLHLERGALIVFSPRFEDFPLIRRPHEKNGRFRCTPPITGFRLENIAITGEGTIDGSGGAWRPVKKEKLTARQWKDLVKSGGVVSSDDKVWYPSAGALNGAEIVAAASKNKGATAADYAGAREFLRPPMVEFIQCRTILIDGPTIQNSPAWTLVPVQSENIVIRNTFVLNPWWGQNTDGIDLSSCRNVLIANCVVDVGDDAICIKPGVPAPGSSTACENIIVDDCTVYHGHGGLVIGSESYGGAKNIVGRNLTFSGTDVGLRFKSARDRGGLVEHVSVSDVRMTDIADEAILFDMSYGSDDAKTDASAAGKKDKPRERIPHFRNFTIERITVRGAARAGILAGLEDRPLEQIVLKNVLISSTEGLVVGVAEGIRCDSVTVLTKKGSPFVIENARSVDIASPGFRPGTAVAVDVRGGRTAAVRITTIATDAANDRVRLSSEVKAGEVSVNGSQR